MEQQTDLEIPPKRWDSLRALHRVEKKFGNVWQKRNPTQLPKIMQNKHHYANL